VREFLRPGLSYAFDGTIGISSLRTRQTFDELLEFTVLGTGMLVRYCCFISRISTSNNNFLSRFIYGRTFEISETGD
jgi:hypothetical protein